MGLITLGRLYITRMNFKKILKPFSISGYRKVNWIQPCFENYHISRKNSTHIKNNVIQNRISLEIPNESLYSFMMRSIVCQENKVALVDGLSKESLTYDDIQNSVRSLGVCLQKTGFGEGDVLGIMSPNNAQYIIATLAALGCKGIVSPINHTYTEYEMVNQLKDSQTKILVVSESNLEKALKGFKAAGLGTIIVIGEPQKHDKDVLPWNDLISEDNSDFPFVVGIRGNDNIAFLPYSSGTTGKPKGVQLTHSNIISNVLQCQHASRDIPTVSTLGLLPFFHIYGLVVTLLYSLDKGDKVVILPSFKPDAFLQSISEHKVERLNLVPPLLQFLWKSELVDNYDLSHVKDITIGAASCADSLVEAVARKFPNSIIRQGYGLTETSSAAMVQFLDNMTSGSCGIPVANTEVKIVDMESGTTLGPYSTGEVHIRGPQVMRGYLNRPSATKECLSEDGWLQTGDLAYYNDDHQFFIVDRLKELIKYKALPIAPAELEAVLVSHSKVVDAAVIGVQDKDGEVPKAYVIGKEGITEKELLLFVEERVAPHKKLRGGVKFVKEIPRAPSGKILRRVLREQDRQWPQQDK